MAYEVSKDAIAEQAKGGRLRRAIPPGICLASEENFQRKGARAQKQHILIFLCAFAPLR
ncbi:hypothetical protein WMF20_48575 [Sorangium sp. So ce834]|uniref:hypothetical protein n=1 Tax=Sorangium sp. So ce834 TaxID=3133321 RepID=UPI003F62AB1C